MGILGAVLFGVWGGYINKYVPGVKGLVRGHLPLSVFGLFLLTMMIVNPLLGRIRRSLRLLPGEAATIFALLLVSCVVVDAGLLRHFPRSLIQPFQQYRLHPGWQQEQILKDTPGILLVNHGEPNDELLNDYLTAMAPAGKYIPLSAVPWKPWLPPLLFWSAMVALSFAAALALSLVVHRQWSDKERIRYPLAELASSMLHQDEEGRNPILRSRAFWIGLGVVLFVRLLNGLAQWFPAGISIPLTFDFSALSRRFPDFMRTPGADSIALVALYPAVIGLTYLLASDIGFTLGISNLVSVVAFFIMFQTGVNTTGSEVTGGLINWFVFGGFLAMSVMIAYFGRRYYGSVFAEALTGRRRAENAADSVWASRVFLLSLVCAVALLIWAGLDWPLAILSMALLVILFMVIARLNAECGVFFFSPGWAMPGIVVGILGFHTIGPTAIIFLGLMMYVLAAAPFECLMPYSVNGLKVAASAGLKPGAVAIVTGAGLALTVALAIPMAVWADHNNAAEMLRGGDTSEVFDSAVRCKTELRMSEQLTAVERYSPLQRLRHASPEPGCLKAMGLGFGLLIGLSLLRLRCTWWPLHPLIVLVFASSTARFAGSFFLGWLAKALIMKFGGAARYSAFRPFMIGVIVGDLSGGFLLMLSNWIYYAATGLTPPGSWLLW